MADNLPLELVEGILSWAYPETPALTLPEGAMERKKDLHSCTLVSRSWNVAATVRLFRGIGYSFSYDVDAYGQAPGTSFRFGTPLYRWVDAPVASTIGERLAPLKSLEQLYSFLSQHALARNSVQHLKLHGYVSSVGEGNENAIDGGTLVSLISTLPNLRRLDLVDLAILPSPLPEGISMRRLERVTLAYTPNGHRYSIPYSQLDTLHVLSYLGAIERLQIIAPPPERSRAHPYLQGVIIELPALRPQVLILGPDTCQDGYGLKPGNIIRALLKQPSTLSRIRGLRLLLRPTWSRWWDSGEGTGLVSQLAGAVGRTLETLELVLDGEPPKPWNDPDEPRMSLRSCRALRSLKFIIHIDDQTAGGFRNMLHILVPLLHSFHMSKSTAPAFTFLTFDVSITDFGSRNGDSLKYVLTREDADTLAHNSLDFTLVSFCKHMELERIRFDYCGRFGTTQSMAEKIICAAFPRVRESDLMELRRYWDQTSIE